jgi:hypothetical protein
MAGIGGKDGKIRMRVIGYGVHVDGQDVPEMSCLVTDLYDWEKHPADVLAPRPGRSSGRAVRT